MRTSLEAALVELCSDGCWPAYIHSLVEGPETGWFGRYEDPELLISLSLTDQVTAYHGSVDIAPNEEEGLAGWEFLFDSVAAPSAGDEYYRRVLLHTADVPNFPGHELAFIGQRRSDGMDGQLSGTAFLFPPALAEGLLAKLARPFVGALISAQREVNDDLIARTGRFLRPDDRASLLGEATRFIRGIAEMSERPQQEEGK